MTYRRPQHRDSIGAYALAFAIVVVTLILLSLLAKNAEAGGFRAAPACGHRAAAVSYAPAAAIVPYPAITYQVGEALQGRAVAEYAFRRSPSQDRLTFLEGFYAHATLAAAPAAEPSSGETSAQFQRDVQRNFSAPTPAEAEPCESCDQAATDPPGFLARPDDFAATHPRTAAACLKCHAGPDAVGGFSIAAKITEAKAARDCETLLAIVDSIVSDRMPDKKPLDGDEKAAVLAEILAAP